MSDTRRLRYRAGPGLFLALLAVASAAYSEDPRIWLMRMAQSVEQLNYEGTLVHMHGGEADILRIVHRVKDGRVTERITAMDGAGREIIRNDDEVTCILPDKKTVRIEPRDRRNRKQSPLQGRLPRIDTLDERLYSLLLESSATVAGRAARILEVEPMDQYRYGYRLWLDEATAMPLKTQLRDVGGGVLESILFTEIQLPAEIPDSALESGLDTNGFRVMRGTNVERGEDAFSVDWHVADLPSGFALLMVNSKLAPGAAMPTEQLVYSDGLAWVSVFIEAEGAADAGSGGISSMGAANAYTFSNSGHQITAVGEVPVLTVERIARSTEPVVP